MGEEITEPRLKLPGTSEADTKAEAEAGTEAEADTEAEAGTSEAGTDTEDIKF